jgi:hypothetical protein
MRYIKYFNLTKNIYNPDASFIKMEKRLLYFCAVALLIFFFILTAILIAHTNSVSKCNYNDPAKSYIKKEPNCVINFLCIKDKVAFRDACGCGCQ